MKITRADQNAVGLAEKDGPETSKEAAVAVFPRSGTQRYRVLEAYAHRSKGLTDEEMEQFIDMDYNSFGPRRRELVSAGWVENSGEVRRSRWGINQVVWQITPEGLREWKNHV